MKKETIFQKLNTLYESCPQISITDEDKYVIFSDVHLGNGGYQDDFKQNSELFKQILTRHYLPRNYKLILNGDIEELYKFKMSQITHAWGDVFNIFNEFRSKDRLIKIFGNHDFALHRHFFDEHSLNLFEGVRLEYNGNTIFVYHGHQTTNFFEDYFRLSSMFGRYILNPIGYKNMTLPIDDESKLTTEKIAYNFSAEKKVISIIGHTHRPLFESHSKIDSLKMKIELLLTELHANKNGNRDNLVKTIKAHKTELDKLYDEKRKSNQRNSIYNNKLMVPCLFNSGSVIGKRGATGIEINKGKISLVYWFDERRSRRYLDYDGVVSKRMGTTSFHKAILKRDSLENIFLRIKLLA
ncbi:MAG: metallophosphoesterase family protein [Candidatus Kapabacteria bacterium]|nr:metallophosphoesterase family protein [Ignavibacteriota bacterium]MCW5884744.1 metallophosphoesterase family protein [Candidatus Kapabacteria bacterium]